MAPFLASASELASTMSLCRTLARLSALFAAVLAAAGANAQGGDSARAPAPQPRQRIALVLSGGGARGGAHIGVIKALQELRVPIDAIAGTSIGAIVGGFYVSGMTVEDMQKLVESLEWEDAFLNVTPRKLKSFRRKRDDYTYLVNQKPGLNGGQFQLPAGLVQGQVFDMVISRETLRASQVKTFDDLAVPFRAVATDLATGRPVVLESGDLARSLRASMSIPAALTPVEIDGRLLVDGGVSMNLPIGVAQKMGADVIIAVDVSSPLMTRETLKSVVDVTTQLTNLLGRASVDDELKKLKPNDVLIVPPFSPDFSSINFARMHEAIETGYNAVMERRVELSRYALDEDQYAAYVQNIRDPRMRELPKIDFIKIQNNSKIADSVIETRLEGIELGKVLDMDKVERSVNKVYGLEYYQNVRYGLTTQDGDTGLLVQLDKRSWGPHYLQLGMQYSSGGDVDALFGLAASYLSTAINPAGGEWRATFAVGDEPQFSMDLYQPFGAKGLYFYAPSVNFRSTIINVWQGDQRITEADNREGDLEFGVGREMPSWGEYRFGLRRGGGETKLRVGDPSTLGNQHFELGELFARFEADTLDNVSFPRSGTVARSEWRGSRTGLGSDSEFDQLLFSVVHANTWGRHTVVTTFRYDTTMSGDPPLNRQFQMGGFLDLSGLSHDQLTGPHAARIGASYYRRIGDLALFPAFAGMSLEFGNVWQSRSEISAKSAILGGSLWAGVQTPVGPVYVGYGHAEAGAGAFYVYLGRVF
jgi:NTE family protein